MKNIKSVHKIIKKKKNSLIFKFIYQVDKWYNENRKKKKKKKKKKKIKKKKKKKKK